MQSMAMIAERWQNGYAIKKLLLFGNFVTVFSVYSTNDPYQLYSAGRNEHGQLGVDDQLVRQTPTIIRGVYRAVHISSASQHALATTVDGYVYGWGEETQGQLTLIPENGIPVQGGSSHSFDVLHPTILTLLIADKIRIASTGREHSLVCTWDGTVLSFGRSTLL